jgi:hypothetical protein
MFASLRTDVSPARAEFEKLCFIDEILESTDATKRDVLEMEQNSPISFLFGGNDSDPQDYRLEENF